MIWSKWVGWLRLKGDWTDLQCLSLYCASMSPIKNKDNKYFTGCLWETKDKPEPGFWLRSPLGPKVYLFLSKCRCNGMFSPKNWLFSLFPSNDPWENRGHSHVIAHSCGLHSLDNTSSTGFKVQRNEHLLQSNDKFVRVSSFFSVLYPGHHLTGGNVGP